ncbi:hypothetical protein A2714_05140 [Candidatus Woesebacteria bacterium RIFCSPHIGHO2_01_FULL_38_9]|uniref:Toxin n=2 Tax=Candidatus Woeseibacteriota TaxID=1752722 RepID=A0A1F7Y0K3_9BACT|nr:MAG: hypothetical protein A2714_05140 [Candidatus Woesebacteria bacterium RIFCSPHIGHO2_01_FULL_38_9]OGM59039.1 MAG: hypothetical protein A3A75_05205 [Candidatus Woesebacteria bacterium RIFCSPLOWO2_01_FULL_39_10]
MKTVKNAFEFEWDKWNIDKNKLKHNVNNKEAEEAFYDNKKVIYKDEFHSEKESRNILIGKTREGRLLYIAFTERNGKVRVISVRDINKKEVKFYEK